MTVELDHSTVRGLPRPFALFIVGFAVLCAFVTIYLWSYDHERLGRLTREDGVLEAFTAIAYFVASGCYLVMALGTPPSRKWCWIFFLLFFLVAAEEISWGQRLMKVSTPQVLRGLNVQQEISIHNLSPVHGHTRLVAILFQLAFSVALPLGFYVLNSLRRLVRWWKVPMVPLWVSPIIVLAAAIMSFSRFAYHTADFPLDEVGETFIALAMLCFAFNELWKYVSLRRTRTSDSLVRI